MDLNINEFRDKILEILMSKGVTIKTTWINYEEYAPNIQNEIEFYHNDTYYWLYIADDGSCGWYIENLDRSITPSGWDYEDFQFHKVIEFVENNF